MTTKTEIRLIFSKTDDFVRMSAINPETSPSKYRVLKEMVDTGEIELFHGHKVRKLWEFKRTPGLVIPVQKDKKKPVTGIWTVW